MNDKEVVAIVVNSVPYTIHCIFGFEFTNTEAPLLLYLRHRSTIAFIFAASKCSSNFVNVFVHVF